VLIKPQRRAGRIVRVDDRCCARRHIWQHAHSHCGGQFINPDDEPKAGRRDNPEAMDTMTDTRAHHAEHHGSARVLVVDDHALLANGLCLELGKSGFETAAIGGPTAEAIIDRARAWDPQIVLLDMHLGDAVGSGLDLIGGLKQCGAVVVVLTGATDQLLLAACVEAGAVGIISKTESFPSLCAAIERAARNERLLPPTRREELLGQLREQRRAQRSREVQFGRMTQRECEVLARMMDGQSAATIAEESFVSLATVRTQIRSILQKLDATSQLAAVATAYQAGWSLEPATDLAPVTR
jgi:DNA-binding NarL/FixJ family response regulator